MNEWDKFMCQAENRFKFLADWHFHCTLVDDNDKLIVVERGECMIVMNFHPVNSYSDYRIGCKWNEPMRVLADSDEGRFGGHQRLEWGHANSAMPQDGFHNRNHSIMMYLPSRTCQILVPERYLQGGIRIFLMEDFLTNVPAARDCSFIHIENKMNNGQKETKELEELRFDANRGVKIDKHEASFLLRGKDGSEIKCASEFDGQFHCYFPGTYMVRGIGVIEAVGPYELEAFEEQLASPKTSKDVERRAAGGYAAPVVGA